MRKLLTILIVIAIGFFVMTNDDVFKKKEKYLAAPADAVLVYDMDKGKVLYEEHSKESLPIASMTKIMTQYVVLEAIEKGRLSWDTPYQASANVAENFSNAGFVRLGLQEGQTYTIEQLFTAMTVTSANDAAVALAEAVSETEEAFVQRMNETAKALKMKDTMFYNASGLDGNYIGRSEEETNHASALDMAKLSEHLLTEYPIVLDFMKITDFTSPVSGERLWSTNYMLPGMPNALRGMDGLKTGYTELAGECFTGTGIFDGRRMITVVMNVNDSAEDSSAAKFSLTKRLIEEIVLANE